MSSRASIIYESFILLFGFKRTAFDNAFYLCNVFVAVKQPMLINQE